MFDDLIDINVGSNKKISTQLPPNLTYQLSSHRGTSQIVLSGQEQWAVANVGDSLHWLSSLHRIHNSVISAYFHRTFGVYTVCILY